MALFIGVKAAPDATVTKTNRQRRSGHSRSLPVFDIDLSQPGRLRVGHMMKLFNVSHSTFYDHVRDGRIPKPDGKDGVRSYWLTTTVVKALNQTSSSVA